MSQRFVAKVKDEYGNIFIAKFVKKELRINDKLLCSAKSKEDALKILYRAFDILSQEKD